MRKREKTFGTLFRFQEKDLGKRALRQGIKIKEGGVE